MDILYIGPVWPEYLGHIEACKPEGTLVSALEGSDPQVKELLPRAEYLLTLAPVTAEMIAAAPRLKLIQMVGIGYERIDVAAASRAGIPVAITSGSNANTVAEHIMALTLALWRFIPYADRSVKAGGWPQAELYRVGGRELAGKTFGLVGLGHIGRAVVPKARGLDLRLLYYDIRRPSAAEEEAMGLSYAPLPDLLRQADIVSLQVPLLPQTRGLIGQAELALMKPSAVLVTTCRGGVVNEAALLDALQNGRLGGAALDVFEVEPLPPDSPWLRFQGNVILTPHVGGAATEAVRRTFRMSFDNVLRVAAGQPPLNQVPV